MSDSLHKDLQRLLEFYVAQRENPPATFSRGESIIPNPSFFTVESLQSHLNNPLLNPDWVRIKTNEKNVSLEPAVLHKFVQGKNLTFLDKELLNGELRKGAAVVFEGLDILDPAINVFCARLEDKLPCGMANSVAFFSQAGNEAYKGHFDTDDVLVIQLAGEKTWQLFKPQQRRYKNIANQSDAQLGPVENEVVMKPGDALYVRTGVPHRCSTSGDFSLHLAFDLIDRTPNIEQISARANQRYMNACEQPYEPGSKVVDRYIDVLKAGDFRTEIANETLNRRMEIIDFRQRSVRVSSVNELNKYAGK